jgi:hypothetical protein
VPDDVPITAISEGVRGYVLDPNNAEALWKKSDELGGRMFLAFFAYAVLSREFCDAHLRQNILLLAPIETNLRFLMSDVIS